MKRIISIIIFYLVLTNFLFSFELRKFNSFSKAPKREKIEEVVQHAFASEADFYKRTKQIRIRFKDVKFKPSKGLVIINKKTYYAPDAIPSNHTKKIKDFNNDDILVIHTLFNVIVYIEHNPTDNVVKHIDKVIAKSNANKSVLNQWYVKDPTTLITVGVPLAMTMKYHGDYDNATNSQDAIDFRSKTKTFQTVTIVSLSANLVYHFYDDVAALFSKKE